MQSIIAKVKQGKLRVCTAADFAAHFLNEVQAEQPGAWWKCMLVWHSPLSEWDFFRARQPTVI